VAAADRVGKKWKDVVPNWQRPRRPSPPYGATSLSEEAEILRVGEPVLVRPRDAVTGKACERLAAEFLFVDDADLRAGRDLRRYLLLLRRGAGMRASVRKRHALAPFGPDALLSEHAGTRQQQHRQNDQASHAFPPSDRRRPARSLFAS